jgi:hypothetical protein
MTKVSKKYFFENFLQKVFRGILFRILNILSYSWTKFEHSPLFSALWLHWLVQN